ncbi:alanine racemase [Oceaniovalibus guishaninsula JLT2003]|uniref:Alanine racemase n=1 Tax=Oceaniovalibus guishaninsula JLT2003 TaxID=1231392 RepID=K2GR47_9RHOB|nr:alanine racemase [Oceaniovalibus guishaninsula]EKE45071.1 alanine racemase [Oceaniovalibus guishaninsula JLT2003]
MATGSLTIDLAAIAANWRALDALGGGSCRTGAVVKADAYGLGASRVAPALAQAGARDFFVAVAEEGAALRKALGPGPDIYVFAGHMNGDAAAIRDADLIPLLNSPEQVERHFRLLPRAAFGVQLDTGMNRLGLEPDDWRGLRDLVDGNGPRLAISHLASADEPDHSANAAQLRTFVEMTEGLNAPRSLAATGGALLGRAWHFDMIRPGIGLYGGLPYADAVPAVRLSLPVVQQRDVAVGESVGYGNAWHADRPSRVATLASGYADGLPRAIGQSGSAKVYAGATACPIIGRVSMDLLTVDVTDLDEVPDTLEMLCEHQGIDALADLAGTIGYEILTSLGHRYERHYAA